MASTPAVTPLFLSLRRSTDDPAETGPVKQQRSSPELPLAPDHQLSGGPKQKRRRKANKTIISGDIDLTQSEAAWAPSTFPVALSERIVDPAALRRMRVPRVSQNPKEVLRQVGSDSKEYRADIEPLIVRGFVQKELLAYFHVSEAFCIDNKALAEQYTARKAEIKAEAEADGSGSSLGDLYGYLYLPDDDGARATVRQLAESGVPRGNLPDSKLAVGASGVSLCRHPDRSSPVSGLAQRGWLLVCRYVRGRVWLCTEGASVPDPQPGCDCHVSRGHLSQRPDGDCGGRGAMRDSYHSSQVMLFEYGPDMELAERPRHVLPVAAIRFEFAGVVKLGLCADGGFPRKPKQQGQQPPPPPMPQKEPKPMPHQAPKLEPPQQRKPQQDKENSPAPSSSAALASQGAGYNRLKSVTQMSGGGSLVGEISLTVLGTGWNLQLGLASLEPQPFVFPFLQLGAGAVATPCLLVGTADLEAQLADCAPLRLDEENPVSRVSDTAGCVSYLAGMPNPACVRRLRPLCQALCSQDKVLLVPVAEAAGPGGHVPLCYLVPPGSPLAAKLRLTEAGRRLGGSPSLMHCLVWLPVPRRRLLDAASDPGAQWEQVCHGERRYELQNGYRGLLGRMREQAGRPAVQLAPRADASGAPDALVSTKPSTRTFASKLGSPPAAAQDSKAPSESSSQPAEAPPASTAQPVKAPPASTAQPPKVLPIKDPQVSPSAHSSGFRIYSQVDRSGQASARRDPRISTASTRDASHDVCLAEAANPEFTSPSATLDEIPLVSRAPDEHQGFNSSQSVRLPQPLVGMKPATGRSGVQLPHQDEQVIGAWIARLTTEPLTIPAGAPATKVSPGAVAQATKVSPDAVAQATKVSPDAVTQATRVSPTVSAEVSKELSAACAQAANESPSAGAQAANKSPSAGAQATKDLLTACVQASKDSATHATKKSLSTGALATKVSSEGIAHGTKESYSAGAQAAKESPTFSPDAAKDSPAAVAQAINMSSAAVAQAINVSSAAVAQAINPPSDAIDQCLKDSPSAGARVPINSSASCSKATHNSTTAGAQTSTRSLASETQARKEVYLIDAWIPSADAPGSNMQSEESWYTHIPAAAAPAEQEILSPTCTVPPETGSQMLPSKAETPLLRVAEEKCSIGHRESRKRPLSPSVGEQRFRPCPPAKRRQRSPRKRPTKRSQQFRSAFAYPRSPPPPPRPSTMQQAIKQLRKSISQQVLPTLTNYRQMLITLKQKQAAPQDSAPAPEVMPASSNPAPAAADSAAPGPASFGHVPARLRPYGFFTPDMLSLLSGSF